MREKVSKWLELKIYETTSSQKKEKTESSSIVPKFLTSASGSVSNAELSMIAEEIKSSWQPRKHYNTKVPESIKSEVGNYALVHGTKAALEKWKEVSKVHIRSNFG